MYVKLVPIFILYINIESFLIKPLWNDIDSIPKSGFEDEIDRFVDREEESICYDDPCHVNKSLFNTSDDNDLVFWSYYNNFTIIKYWNTSLLIKLDSLFFKHILTANFQSKMLSYFMTSKLHLNKIKLKTFVSDTQREWLCTKLVTQ